MFGATVELGRQWTAAEVTYQIVGEDEADISQGKISISSPIARALIGKREGDEVEVDAPGGARELRECSTRTLWRAESGNPDKKQAFRSSLLLW